MSAEQTGTQQKRDVSTGMRAQYATFQVGEFLFGVDVMKVQEIIRYQEMTPAPLSSPVIRGLINLRGQIITAIDLRRRLGLADRGSDKLPMNVVVRTADEVVSLLVDHISDVLEVGVDTFEATPETIDAGCREVISGVHKLDGALLLILDVEKATELTQFH